MGFFSTIFLPKLTPRNKNQRTFRAHHPIPSHHLTSIRQRSFVACGCVAATIFDRLGGEVCGSRCRVQRTRPGTWRHRPRGGAGMGRWVLCCCWWFWLDDGFETWFFLGGGGDADENDAKYIYIDYDIIIVMILIIIVIVIKQQNVYLWFMIITTNQVMNTFN